jgi:hypothetical protein
MRVTIGSFDAGRRTIRGGCRSRDALEVVQRNHQKRLKSEVGREVEGARFPRFCLGLSGIF